MAEQLDEAAVGQVLQILQHSQTPDTAVQARLQEQLEQHSCTPGFNQALGFVFTSMHDQPLHTRMQAGLLLKNNVGRAGHQLVEWPLALLQVLQTQVIQGLADPERMIRRTAGTCVAALARVLKATDPEAGGLDRQWPGLLPTLIDGLQCTDDRAVDGCLDCLFKITQEDAIDPQLVVVVAPKLFDLLPSTNPGCRAAALAVLVQFYDVWPGLIDEQSFLQALCQLAADTDPNVRVKVCEGFNVAVSNDFKIVLPHITGVIEFMLQCMMPTPDVHNALVLEALWFWQCLIEAGSSEEEEQAMAAVSGHAALLPHLPALLPIILEGMIYGEDDPAMEHADPSAADSHIPDSSQDVAPGQKDRAETDAEFANYDCLGTVDGESSNRRASSAAVLRLLADAFPVDLLPVFLPLLEQLLQGQDWLRRECGIFAIGLVATGCEETLAPHMDAILPVLANAMDDSMPLVRCGACWAVEQWAGWMLESATDGTRPELLDGVLSRLLVTCSDTFKNVQRAALGSLEEFMYNVGLQCEVDEIITYLEPLVDFMVAGLASYQANNKRKLLGVMTTFADAATADTLAMQPATISKLLPQLLAELETTQEGDHVAIVPLLRCLSALVGPIGGETLLPFFGPLFRRAVHVVKERTEILIAVDNPAEAVVVAPDFESAEASLDLLSSFMDTIPPNNLQEVVAETDFMSLLAAAVQFEPQIQVRRPLVMLLGDCARVLWFQLLPHAHIVVPQLVEILGDPRSALLCSNAAWALGEITVQAGEDMNPFVEPMCARLVALLLAGSRVKETISQNAATTLGRLAASCPRAVASSLQVVDTATMLRQWHAAIETVADGAEKNQARSGLQAIRQVLA